SDELADDIGLFRLDRGVRVVEDPPNRAAEKTHDRAFLDLEPGSPSQDSLPASAVDDGNLEGRSSSLEGSAQRGPDQARRYQRKIPLRFGPRDEQPRPRAFRAADDEIGGQIMPSDVEDLHRHIEIGYQPERIGHWTRR